MLEYLQVHNEISWGLKSEHNNVFVLNICNLCLCFNCNLSHEVICGIGAFQIFGLGMYNLYYTIKRKLYDDQF